MVEFLRTIYYWVVTGGAAVLSFILFPCRVCGRENIPPQGGCIYASNHESNIDPVLLPVVSPRQMRFMAKDSLFKNPFFGALIRCGGGIPLKRGAADRGALGEALHEIKRGYPVLIFPQGTRGGVKIQAGVGFLAVNSGAPVVPICIEGTDRVLPKGASFPKRSSVKVTFGKPMTFRTGTSSQEAADQVMEAINALKSQV
jgi:1-acyl-sn-glycerol-3-phosphate acyltransferase